ncbi:MAG: hypothetical protein H0X34_19030 [Chthoniobacterales bacterium]|nr:hypothetical protein [Chthoniobacterales bacterium]
MANSFGTLNTTLIAQKTLTTLLAKFPLLSKISTNFSDTPLLFGQSLRVKLATARTAIAYSTTNGYVPADSTLTDTTVTLNQHIHDTYQVNDQEATSTNINLIDKFAGLSAYALGRAIMDALWNLVINANYANSTTVAVGVFDRAALIDVNRVMDDRFVPDLERLAILNTAYFAALKKDLVVVSNNINPATERPIQTGVLPDVDGDMVIKVAVADANAENLAGAVMLPEAMALATTVPNAPPSGLPVQGNVNLIRDENSGLAIQVREWYDFALGQHRRTSTLMYGVAVGNPLMLQRILSA